MPRVYLSGGMEYAADEGRDWRRGLQSWLESELHCSVFNPNAESDRFLQRAYPGVDMRALKFSDIGAFTEIVRQLVDLDCREIAERTDFVVCYWDEAAQRGAGTKGELTMARHSGKPAYLVTAMPVEDIPGWVLGCTSRIFDSFDDLKSSLKESAVPPTNPVRPQR
ncbi:MAG: hypothetical protein AB1428_14775 [Bacteroidota bacterium]